MQFTKKHIAIMVVMFVFVAAISGCSRDPTPIPVKPTLSSDSEESENSPRYIRKKDQNRGVIIFMHGFTGDSTETWTNAETGAYWPELLSRDSTFDGLDIYVFEYPTSLFSESFSIDEIAERVRLFLDADQVSTHQELIFLTHSMGGVVTRAYLNKYDAIAEKVSLVYFFSTPTTGSHMANLANVFIDNPQISQLTKMSSESYLADVQRTWLAKQYAIDSYCAYEKQTIRGVLIVGQESATNLCNKRLDPIDANHIDMVKPRGLRDERYLAFKSAFLATNHPSLQVKAEAQTPQTLTPTPPVLPTPAPGEAQIVGGVFVPPDFNGYDAAGLILSRIENELVSRGDLIRTVVYPYVINHDVQARSLACEAEERIVIWGTSHTQNVVVNITSCYDPTAIRRNYYVVAEPRDGRISLQDLDHDAPFLVSFVLARLYYLQGRYEDAQRAINRAIQATDDRVPEGIEHAYLLRGNIHDIAENYDDALADFSAALRIDPLLVEARYNHALVSYRLGDEAGALKELNTLLEDDPSYRNAYVFRGAIYSVSETPDGLQQAVADFSKVINLSPAKHGAVFDALFNRALVYIQLEDFGHAETDLERMLGVKHDCAPLYEEDIIQKEPGDGDLWCGQAANALASLYVESLDTQYEEGKRLAQLALEKIEMPFYRVYIYDTLSRSYEKLGQCDLAVQAVEEGLLIQPDASFLNETLAYLREKC